MKSLKQLATVTALAGTLCIPVLAMAEPTPPAGSTVNSIALSTVETNMRSSNGQMMPSSMSSGMNAPTDSTTGAQMGSMSSSMHDNSMPGAGMNHSDNNMATPMTSDMNMSDRSTTAPVTSPQATAP